MLIKFLENIELFFAALIAGFFGQGGGVLYTPIQLWNGRDFHDAASISLFLIVITSFSATIIYRKSKKVDWKLALLFEIPTTIGAFAGGYFSHYISSVALKFLLVGIILLAAYFLFFPLKMKPKEKQTTKPSFWIIKHNKNDLILQIDMRLMLPIMIVIGALTGMLGIGGGILKVPVMLLLFNIPMAIAIGSSAFMVGITAFGGLLGHISHSSFDWQLALLFSVPVILGALVGSFVSVRMQSKQLIKYFGAFLVIMAIYTAFQTFF